MTLHRVRRKPGENRQRLLSAGITEFGCFGFHGTSTAAIARRAEVPQPHLYASFPSKRCLFVECCQTSIHALLKTVKWSHTSAEWAHPDLNQHLRMLYQSIAVCNDRELTKALHEPLHTLREAFGPRFDDLVARAATALLSGEK